MARSNLILNVFYVIFLNIHFAMTVIAEIIILARNVEPNETIYNGFI